MPIVLRHPRPVLQNEDGPGFYCDGGGRRGLRCPIRVRKQHEKSMLCALRGGGWTTLCSCRHNGNQLASTTIVGIVDMFVCLGLLSLVRDRGLVRNRDVLCMYLLHNSALLHACHPRYLCISNFGNTSTAFSEQQDTSQTFFYLYISTLWTWERIYWPFKLYRLPLPCGEVGKGEKSATGRGSHAGVSGVYLVNRLYVILAVDRKEGSAAVQMNVRVLVLLQARPSPTSCRPLATFIYSMSRRGHVYVPIGIGF